MDVVLIRQSTAQWLREVVASLWYALGPQLASVLSVMVKGVAMAELCRYPESGVDICRHTANQVESTGFQILTLIEVHRCS